MAFNSYINFILKNRIIKHILFWLFYAVWMLTQAGIFEEKDLRLELIVFSFLLPIRMAFTYILLYLLFPRFFVKGNMLGFIFTTASLISLAVFSQRALAHYIIYPTFHEEGLKYGYLCISCLIYGYFGYFLLFGYAASLKIFKLWYVNQQNTQKMQKEKLEAELKFLKAQIHPHFLFNTLNNLYALTLKKSDQAPTMVLKLSDLLHYMLYDCNASRVMLDKEIESVKNYLELEKLRYGQNLKVEFHISGSLTAKQIAPMLIIPFVENAFKHGLSEQVEKSFVNINATVEGDYFMFVVENSKSSSALSATDRNGYKEGIGLKNVKRRLELQYKNKYELDIVDGESEFKVTLRLKICNADPVDLTSKEEPEEEEVLS